MPTCRACQTNYSLTAADTPCPRCGMPLPTPKRAGTPWYMRWYLVVGLMVVVCGAVAGIGVLGGRGQGSDAGSTSGVWSYERQTISGHLADWQTAERAGNIPHAQQLQEQILKDCQTGSVLRPDTSADHGAVQRACASIGVTVP